MPQLPLPNRFSKCVPGPQNSYPRICNSEVRLSRDLKNRSLLLLLTFATISYERWTINALDDRANYNVPSTDDVAETLNQSLRVYARVICPTVDLCNS